MEPEGSLPHSEGSLPHKKISVMTYKAKVIVCSTRHSMQSKHQVEFLKVKPGGTQGNCWALKG
jgi:hypothetical protein